MSVLADTPVWSFVLRRRRGGLSESQTHILAEWTRLMRERSLILIGPVRQELLSGVRDEQSFQLLRSRLDAFADEPIGTIDYIEAARCCNICRAAGVAGSAIDYLICAVALRLGVPVFTTDKDFERYSRHLPFKLHQPRVG